MTGFVAVSGAAGCAPERSARSEAKGAERGLLHQHSAGESTAGKLLRAVATVLGLTLHEAAVTAHGAQEAARRVSTATKHFTADIWEVKPLDATQGCRVDVLWASPDCTYFSVAQDGTPREKGMLELFILLRPHRRRRRTGMHHWP